MANIKLDYGSSTETAWNSTGRITSPSLILVDGSTTRYTPIYSGSAGGTITDGNYKSTLGHLIVADKRVALSRYQYKFTDSVTIGHYFTQSKSSKTSPNPCNPCSTWTTWSRDTTIYIIVRGTSIGNGSLSGVWADGGSGTTSTSYWYPTRSWSDSFSSSPSIDGSLWYTLTANFTSSSGTSFKVSKACLIYNGSEHTDTLSTEVTI